MTRGRSRADAVGMITNSLEAAVAARPRPGRRRRRSSVRGLRKAYGERQGARRRRPRRPPRRGARAARPQRRRQDHARRDPRGPPPRRRRRGRACSATTRRKRERAFRERIGIVLQEDGPRPEPHGPRGGRALRRRLPEPARRRRGARAGRARPTAPDARAATLSGGQRRRLDLALGIAGDPELIFLDEPTTGFDPAARRQSWELIAGLRDARQDDPADHPLHGGGPARSPTASSCSRGGRVVAEGTPDALGAATPTTLVTFRCPPATTRCRCPRTRRRARRRCASAPRTPTRDLAPLLEWAAARGMELEGLTVTRPTPRGRLPRAHRGARMTARRQLAPTLAAARPLDRAPASG